MGLLKALPQLVGALISLPGLFVLAFMCKISSGWVNKMGDKAFDVVAPLVGIVCWASVIGVVAWLAHLVHLL